MNIDVTGMKEEFVQRNLPNGVRIIVYPKKDVLTAAFGIFVKTGGWCEKADTESGIAHVIEHMMFKSTKTMSTEKLNNAFDELGAENNAFTDWDRTVYHAVVPYHNLDGLIRLMSEMVRTPLFLNEELKTEKGAILAEVRRYNDEHDEKAMERAQFNLFNKCDRFRDPLIGIEEQIEKMTGDDLFRFYNREYIAGNITLCVVGNCDVVNTINLLSDLWSDMNDREVYPFDEPKSNTCELEYDKLYRNTEQVHVCEMVNVDPSIVSRIRNGREVGAILSKIYGGGITSRLFKEIREKRGLAYASFSYLYRFGSHTRLFHTYVGTDKKNANEVIEIIRMVQDKLVCEDVPESELTRAKTSLTGEIMKRHDDIHQHMLNCGTTLMRTGKPMEVFDRINRVQTVLPYELRDMAIGVFESSHSSRVLCEKQGPTDEQV